jgi:hydrogenase small subunit
VLLKLVIGCQIIEIGCIGCTMPGFPDKFMPFMDAPPGSLVSGTASMAYGSVIRSLRNITLKKTDAEPKWRKKGRTLETGYKPSW